MAACALTQRSDPEHRSGVTSRHLFVCTNDRSAGKPACGPRGGDALVAAVQRELIARTTGDPGVPIDVIVTPCGCLGPCFDGPNAVVYPDGVWYAELTVEDAPALAEYLTGGPPLVAKLAQRPGPSR